MTVTVQYFKYPRTLHWRHDLVHLGEDAHGVWLGAAPGTVVQKGYESPVTMDGPFVQLIPPAQWWTAIFNDPAHPRIAVYVDIVTVPQWVTSGRVEMIDLDLDVIRTNDGTVYVDDEDEFEEHRVSLDYPAHMVDSARAAAARLVLAVEGSDPPFDGTAERWLRKVIG